MLPPPRRVRAMRGFATALLKAIGVRHRTVGQLPRGKALLVANHVSWLDALVLLADAPVRLLTKAEIAGWPLIGRLTTTAEPTLPPAHCLARGWPCRAAYPAIVVS